MHDNSNANIDLAAENERLKSENRELLHVIHALTRKEIDFDRDELLGQVGVRQEFGEFLNELEAREAVS